MNYNVKLLLEEAEELWPTLEGYNHSITLSTREEFDLVLNLVYDGYWFSVTFTEDELKDISWLAKWKEENCISDGIPDFLTKEQSSAFTEAIKVGENEN